MSDKKDKLEGKFVAQCMNGKMQMVMSRASVSVQLRMDIKYIYFKKC